MKRRHFLAGGLSMLSFTPLTPLLPGTGAPSFSIPLPFATVAPIGSQNLYPGVNSVPLYLAAVGPENGPQAMLNEQLQHGVRGAIAETNTGNPVFDRHYELHLYNDLGDPNYARVAARSVIADPSVLVAIGHLGSATTLAALETYAQAQLPLIVPVSTADEITGHGYQNVFRLPTRDSLEGELFSRQLLTAQTYPTVGIVSPTLGYGPAVAHGFAAQARSLGRSVVECRIPPSAYGDALTAALAPIVAARPELTFFAGTLPALEPALRYLLANGVTGTRAASQGFFDPATISRLGFIAEGLLVSSSMPPLSQSTNQLLQLQSYSESYGDFTPVAAFAYAAAQIAMAAIRRTNAITRIPIASALRGGSTYATIVGDFRFDAFGDPTDPNLYFYTVHKGVWVSQGSLRPTRFG